MKKEDGCEDVVSHPVGGPRSHCLVSFFFFSQTFVITAVLHSMAVRADCLMRRMGERGSNTAQNGFLVIGMMAQPQPD